MKTTSLNILFAAIGALTLWIKVEALIACNAHSAARRIPYRM